jgi:hypothetical protein
LISSASAKPQRYANTISRKRMKTASILLLTFLYNSNALAQDTLGSQQIDSVIQIKEKALIYEYKKTIFANDDTSVLKNGSLTHIYKYTRSSFPYARFDIWISEKDTAQIMFYYYDGEELIKAGTIVPANNHSAFYQQTAYFKKGKVIHWLSSDNESFETNYNSYLSRSGKFIKAIKRKPVRFPL